MNSYFASVEQQERPELRGRPVAVAPVAAETTCCIAASYEAKKFGVKTGTAVWEARKMCPGIRVVEARPALYVRYHHRICDVVGRCLPVHKVASIDEMYCRLMGSERETGRAVALAGKIKRHLREECGAHVRCSIGIAPNVLLAKVASDMQKPDGLVVIEPGDIPGRLLGLELRDFPSLGPRMEKRFEQHGIRTVEQLYALSVEEMQRIWRSVTGADFCRAIHGEDLPEKPTVRRSVGHSHVLPPELRNDRGAEAVMIRLIHKAAARLRHMQYWACRMGVHVRYIDHTSWDAGGALGWCQDTLTMLELFKRLWREHPRRQPLKVGMVLYDLEFHANVPEPLFPEHRKRQQLARAMDLVNHKYGVAGIYFADMHETLHAAPMRIAFTSIPDLDVEV